MCSWNGKERRSASILFLSNITLKSADIFRQTAWLWVWYCFYAIPQTSYVEKIKMNTMLATLSIFAPPTKLFPNEPRVSKQQRAVAFLNDLVLLNESLSEWFHDLLIKWGVFHFKQNYICRQISVWHSVWHR